MAPLLVQNVWNKVKQGLYLFYADICCFVVIRKYITFHKFNKLSCSLRNLILFYMFICIYFSMTLCSLEKLFSIHNSSCWVVRIKTINPICSIQMSCVIFDWLIITLASYSTHKHTHCAYAACDSKGVTVAFNGVFWIATKVVYIQCCLVVTWLVPCKTTAVLAHSVCSIQPCTMSRHCMQSHIHRVLRRACLAVT